MVASAGYGKNVMHFRCGSGSAFGQTFFAQRVRGNITVTDAFPCASVFFIDVGTAFILVILAAFLHTMFLTVLSITEIRATGVGTRSLGLARHAASPLHDKSHRGTP